MTGWKTRRERWPGWAFLLPSTLGGSDSRAPLASLSQEVKGSPPFKRGTCALFAHDSSRPLFSPDVSPSFLGTPQIHYQSVSNEHLVCAYCMQGLSKLGLFLPRTSQSLDSGAQALPKIAFLLSEALGRRGGEICLSGQCLSCIECFPLVGPKVIGGTRTFIGSTTPLKLKLNHPDCIKGKVSFSLDDFCESLIFRL